MRLSAFVLICVLCSTFCFAQNQPNAISKVNSHIDSSANNGELVLIQSFKINNSIDAVWDAYTTKKGWESWAVAIAEVDLKIGGVIKTNYNPKGIIGDSSTITTHIINYVPKKLLTLQAEITESFPEFMQNEADDFYNVIYFEEIDSKTTEVSSYGIGYKNNSKYLALMKYFISANEKSLEKLIEYLERK